MSRKHRLKTLRLFAAYLVLAAGCLFLATGSMAADRNTDGASANRLQVMCTTTLLSCIVKAVGGEQIEVDTIVPFGMCPGHFDLTPGEAQKLREADILLYHGCEQFVKGVDLGTRTEAIRTGVKGNWMIPDIHTQAVQRIVGILADRRPAMTDRLSRRSKEYAQAVCAAGLAVRDRLADCRGLPVVCSNMNRDLADWFGFAVIAEYPRDEDISVKTLHEIISKGRKSGVKLVIDNKQSSGKVGRTIARELDVPFALLSNFPDDPSSNVGGYPYIWVLSNNCTTVVEALATDEATP